jgi:hypothetical protein
MTSYMAPQNPLHGTPKPATWHPKTRKGNFKAYKTRGFMIKKSFRYILDISRKAPCRAWAFLEEKKKYIFVEFSFGYSIKAVPSFFLLGDKVLITLSPFISGSF